MLGCLPGGACAAGDVYRTLPVHFHLSEGAGRAISGVPGLTVLAWEQKGHPEGGRDNFPLPSFFQGKEKMHGVSMKDDSTGRDEYRF